MQAMAPGVHGLLHAGHAVGESAAGAGADGGLAMGAGGRWADGAGAGALGRAGAAAPAPTGTGGGAVAPATVKIFWQAGHLTCLPPALSGIWIALVQFGQRITCGMVFLVLSDG